MNNNELESKVDSMQKKLASLEAYMRLSEWLNAEIPTDKKLDKKIGDKDLLLTMAQEMSLYARQKAESIANGTNIDLQVFSADDILCIKKIINGFRLKLQQNQI